MTDENKPMDDVEDGVKPAGVAEAEATKSEGTAATPEEDPVEAAMSKALAPVVARAASGAGSDESDASAEEPSEESRDEDAGTTIVLESKPTEAASLETKEVVPGSPVVIAAGDEAKETSETAKSEPRGPDRADPSGPIAAASPVPPKPAPPPAPPTPPVPPMPPPPPSPPPTATRSLLTSLLQKEAERKASEPSAKPAAGPLPPSATATEAAPPKSIPDSPTPRPEPTMPPIPTPPTPPSFSARPEPDRRTIKADPSRVFEHLVEGEDDVIGLISYSLYKQDKRDWMIKWVNQRGEQPTVDQVDAFVNAQTTMAQRERYRTAARQVLDAYASVAVDLEKPSIVRDAITERVEEAATRIERSFRWWRYLPAALLSAAVTIGILVAAIAILIALDVDIAGYLGFDSGSADVGL